MDFPLGTLILPEPARSDAWRAWRAGLDLDALSYESMQTLPALAASLPRWLEGDLSAARIQGIVKMAWSRNQVRLHQAVEVQRTLRGASIAPVGIAGPLAWTLRTREEGAIRAAPNLMMLIPREHLFRAVSALTEEAWDLQHSSLDADTLNWSDHVALTKGDQTLHLHWRLFSASGGAAREHERTWFENFRTIVWNRHEFQALSPEADLLQRLMDRPSWDPVPWQADVLMMPFAGVDWSRFRQLALRMERVLEPVNVVERLMELRGDWQLPVPQLPPSGSRAFSSSALAIFNRLKFARLRAKLSARRSVPWRP
jgi:Uncharacterised nucleotidyltransferase